MTLTNEQRAKLDGELKALDQLEGSVQAQLAPLQEMLRNVESIRAQTLERYGIEDDPVGHCEGCEMLLLPGDLGHRCGDGPVLCADCAPTWGDLKKQITEPSIIDGSAPDLDEEAEDGIAPRDKLAAVEAHVAGGGSLDDKIIHPL
ncbi:MAG: hypothetical protein ACK4TP_10105 [Hyphomicrobium sp.]